MKVLHLDTGREMRGGQYQVLALHRGLIRRSHDSLLAARADAPLLAAARAEGLPAEPLRIGLIRSAQLVHAHDARSHTLAAIWARCPIIVSRRVAFPISQSLLSRWKYRRASLYLAVSRFVAAELRRAGIPAEKIRVVYDGVQIPAEPATGDRIIALQTDDPAKGTALAQQAAKLAGIDLHLTTDLTRDLPTARAMLYITHSEGLGSGILLAMAHGVPAVASNVGGIPELIEDGVSGILTDNTPEAIASAITRLRPDMSAQARRTVLTRFTEDHMVDGCLSFYLSAAHPPHDVLKR